MKFSKEDILEKISNKYEYDFTGFKNTKSYIILICEEHGDSPVRIDKLISGQICPKCSKKISNEKLRKSKEKYIEECNIKHKNKYDYSLLIYEKCNSYINVICPYHGKFEIRADHHRSGQGCRECYLIKNCKIHSKSIEKFIEDSKEIHGDFFDYSNVEYINNKTPVIIICPYHGEFKQTPHLHTIKKCGCPFCKQSKGEKEIKKYLKMNKMKFIEQKRFENCKNKNKLPFDFYLPDLNVCIEYDGKQHFESVEFFGGEKAFYKIKENDKIKNQYCLENNIGLIRISYKDDINQKLFSFFNNRIY